MSVIAGEQARAGRHAGCTCNMALRKVSSFFDQPVQVGRLHVRKSQASDGVIALLVSDDENDVWLFGTHLILGT